MKVLLDVNVIVALLDPGHTFHDVAHEWFAARDVTWATCPTTQNATIRVISHPKYPNPTGSAGIAAGLISQVCELRGHVFWPDDVSLLDPRTCRVDRLSSSKQVTDSYLLALAVAHSGQLATFDKRIVTSAIPGADRAVRVLGP